MAHFRHTELPNTERNDWQTIRTLLPYLWEYRWRVGLALTSLACAKLATIGVPLALKGIVDALDRPANPDTGLIALPLALLIGYGLLRMSTSVFNELRNAIFAKAAQRSIRRISIEVFQHLHKLSLSFHLDRQTGGLSRDIERGSRSINQLLTYLIFSILPTAFEMVVVCVILFIRYQASFAIVTAVTVTLYFVYTYKVTTWRTQFRVRMNEADSSANSIAVDALINYETVKYFSNEEFEAGRYDHHLQRWERASVKGQTTLAMLNIGQGVIIGSGLIVLMIMAAKGVIAGRMTIGDFVLVNAFLIQLYLPLNFLGTIFREVQHSLTDMERMFALLDVKADVGEQPNPSALAVSHARVAFEHVSFSYRPDRAILTDVNFAIGRGCKVAVVGASGAGKSTLARLLFRFYDVSDGRITIDGQDLRKVSLSSLRAAIGVVPQDTVLFNDTIEYNIRYGRPEANPADIRRAAQHAYLHDFIASLPQGYQTTVGERGLKLSGGEKQRIAIARTILKNPPILILDEATSALDSRAEKAIQQALAEVARDRTTLVIAHRLSTVIDADEILVLERGRIVERGRHRELLQRDNHYARMWKLQQEQEPTPGEKAALASA